jgi:hypothetical protein
MHTVDSSAHGRKRGSQDETSPFPLEFEIVARRKRVVQREGRNQDETAPFPLEFEVVARKAKQSSAQQSTAQQSQDETSPFLLEFMIILPDGAPAFVRTARPPRSPGARRLPRKLPQLKWHGLDASKQLREYAARIAAGESLPPYSGPILESGEFPPVRAARPHAAHAPSAPSADDSKAIEKFALALIMMSAFFGASALLGNDVQLRNVGQAISGWFTGK